MQSIRVLTRASVAVVSAFAFLLLLGCSSPAPSGPAHKRFYLQTAQEQNNWKAPRTIFESNETPLVVFGGSYFDGTLWRIDLFSGATNRIIGVGEPHAFPDGQQVTQPLRRLPPGKYSVYLFVNGTLDGTIDFTVLP